MDPAAQESAGLNRRELFTAACAVVTPLVAYPFTEKPVMNSPESTSNPAWRPEMKNFGHIGKGEPVLDGYREAELLDHHGSGCLTHMWFGGSWPTFERTRIRVYVDAETVPSIDMELGMGHGFGFADPVAPWGGVRLGRTGDPSGLYNTRRIPFGSHIRITGQRHADGPAASPFWWIFRGMEDLPVSLGGIQLPRAARLRLHKLDSFRANPLQEFALFETTHAGALYEVTMAAKGQEVKDGWHSMSFLEACMRAYIDGSTTPLMLSSGLEDYFLGTYYFNRGRFANDLAGLTHFDEKAQEFSAYRFHDEDPVFFNRGLKLTCRCGDTEHGTPTGPPAGDPPTTTFEAYTWVYEW